MLSMYTVCRQQEWSDVQYVQCVDMKSGVYEFSILNSH